MIMLPIVVVPLLLNSLISFVMEQQKEAETEVLEYVIFGEEHAPDLAKAFAETKRFKKTYHRVAGRTGRRHSLG